MNEDYIHIIQLNNDSKHAFVELYDKYAGKIYNYVRSMLRDKSLAEDITQFCFMKVWERRRSIQPERNFAAYLYVIARNAVFKETQNNLTALKFLQCSRTVIGDEFTSQDVDLSILQTEIDRVVETLPEARRRIYIMSVKMHLTNEEIARQLELSPKTVQNQLERASGTLRAELAAFCEK